jgi:hypothetical protein
MRHYDFEVYAMSLVLCILPLLSLRLVRFVNDQPGSATEVTESAGKDVVLTTDPVTTNKP